MSEWQPISTAPKDGTKILMYRDGDVSMAWYRKKYGESTKEWGGQGWSYPEWLKPTHWMPLPDPPNA